MKIVVDNIPHSCYECLFLGSIKNNTYSGCTLLNIKIPFEIGMTTRLGNCPLVEKQSFNNTYIHIVKCKDCKYWTYTCDGDFSIRYGICNCNFWNQTYGESKIETTSEDYCSNGKQK